MRLITLLQLGGCAWGLGCQPLAASELEATAGVIDLLEAPGPAEGTCETFSFAGARPLSAGYFVPAFDAPWTGVTLAQGADLLSLELWYFGANSNPAMPMSVMLWATTRARCDVCVALKRGCETNGTSCARSFLANGGSVSFEAAGREVSSGRLAGSAPIIRFVEWDFAADQERAGGACVEVSDVHFDATW